MLLSFVEIRDLLDAGVVENAKYENINSASLDIRIGNEIMVEVGGVDDYPQILDYRARDKPSFSVHSMNDTGYLLMPGQCILASSMEVFNLPDNVSAEYKLKSSMARIFLEHLNAGWCDAGWNGSVLTLELVNLSRHHSIRIRPGDSIGQIVFFKHTKVPADRTYAVRGRYNGDKQVSTIKE